MVWMFFFHKVLKFLREIFSGTLYSEDGLSGLNGGFFKFSLEGKWHWLCTDRLFPCNEPGSYDRFTNEHFLYRIEIKVRVTITISEWFTYERVFKKWMQNLYFQFWSQWYSVDRCRKKTIKKIIPYCHGCTARHVRHVTWRANIRTVP